MNARVNFFYNMNYHELNMNFSEIIFSVQNTNSWLIHGQFMIIHV
jgi:hypothetical protein